jgi:hypothetical protein
MQKGWHREEISWYWLRQDRQVVLLVQVAQPRGQFSHSLDSVELKVPIRQPMQRKGRVLLHLGHPCMQGRHRVVLILVYPTLQASESQVPGPAPSQKSQPAAQGAQDPVLLGVNPTPHCMQNWGLKSQLMQRAS